MLNSHTVGKGTPKLVGIITITNVIVSVNVIITFM